DDGVAASVQLRTDPARPAAGIEDTRPTRHHGVDQPGLTGQILAFGGHPTESLDVPLRVAVLRIAHPTRQLSHTASLAAASGASAGPEVHVPVGRLDVLVDEREIGRASCRERV